MQPSKQKAIAAYTNRTQPAWIEVPPPGECAAGQIVCRTLQLGVCGTDREIIASGKPTTPAGEEHLILGHECLARVESIGSEVTSVAVGDLVVPLVRRSIDGYAERPDMLPLDRYVERGIIAQHGFSQPDWVDDPHYMAPVPADMADLAVFAEPQSIAEKAVNEATLIQRTRLGESVWSNDSLPRVLVTGMGPIGFACLVAAWSRGWPATMYGRDPSESPRVKLACGLGAEYLNQEEVDLGSLPPAERFDLVLECTGNDAVLLTAAAAVAHCGAMVWLGASRTPTARSHNLDQLMRRTLMHNQVHLGTVNAARRDFDDAISHLTTLRNENAIAASGLITRRAAIDDALDHFARRERQSIKTVFMYE